MLFRTLGTLDFNTILILLGAALLPEKLLLLAAFYLVVKGATFAYSSSDWASYGDIISGCYLFLFSLGIKIPVVHTIIILYLIQKTMLTFIALGIKASLYYHHHFKSRNLTN